MQYYASTREILMSVLSWAGEQNIVIKLIIAKTSLIEALSN